MPIQCLARLWIFGHNYATMRGVCGPYSKEGDLVKPTLYALAGALAAVLIT